MCCRKCLGRLYEEEHRINWVARHKFRLFMSGGKYSALNKRIIEEVIMRSACFLQNLVIELCYSQLVDTIPDS